MNVSFVWQGFYQASMNQYGSLKWTPTAGSCYLVMVSTTASSTGNYTRGVSVNLVTSDNTTVLIYAAAGSSNPPPDSSPCNSNGPQTTEAKSYDSEPTPMPLVCLTWMAPSNWAPSSAVSVTVSPYTPPSAGGPSRLNPNSDWLSVTVVEVDQLPDR